MLKNHWIIVANDDATEYGLHSSESSAGLLFDTKNKPMRIMKVLDANEFSYHKIYDNICYTTKPIKRSMIIIPAWYRYISYIVFVIPITLFSLFSVIQYFLR